MPKTRQTTRTKAWEVWTRNSYDGPSFVAAYKDKGEAQAKMRRLSRSHPYATYYLKHRKVERHMQFGSRRARRRHSVKTGLSLGF